MSATHREAQGKGLEHQKRSWGGAGTTRDSRSKGEDESRSFPECPCPAAPRREADPIEMRCSELKGNRNLGYNCVSKS